MWALGLISLNIPFSSLRVLHILTDMLGEEVTRKNYNTIVGSRSLDSLAVYLVLLELARS
jgi:hypothetical protein